ncbi:hypothetical protein NDU88_001016 [Pleurodeles waltl]|uniref:Uncharacterized protein n=1 Tax=Pleurodeles waltl TaxID=8319 RepID=A0AAV7VAP2_PLEWA|nr:hypothetical protein NDU88_001016 [Pleurodeles waltl]
MGSRGPAGNEAPHSRRATSGPVPRLFAGVAPGLPVGSNAQAPSTRGPRVEPVPGLDRPTHRLLMRGAPRAIGESRSGLSLRMMVLGGWAKGTRR